VSVPAVGSTLANGEVVGFTGALDRAAGENVGTYAINQNTVANGNYAISYTGALLTINQLAVTVTADAKSKTYGDVDPALTFVSVPAVGSTLANGEVVGFTGALDRA
ncbi:MBG domain-containing protein, partial [Mariniradius sediminis]